MASRVVGIKETRAALKRLSPGLREEVFQAVKETADGVHARGKANIQAMVTRRSGTLEYWYRKGLSRKSLRGRVGYLSGRAREEAFYARFIHDGTQHIAARPFHQNAVEAEQEADTRRMVRARDEALKIYARFSRRAG